LGFPTRIPDEARRRLLAMHGTQLFLFVGHTSNAVVSIFLMFGVEQSSAAKQEGVYRALLHFTPLGAFRKD
jgi:hypothetical protein